MDGARESRISIQSGKDSAESASCSKNCLLGSENLLLYGVFQNQVPGELFFTQQPVEEGIFFFGYLDSLIDLVVFLGFGRMACL